MTGGPASHIETIPPSMMTEAALWARQYNALNLASGYPEISAPSFLKEKALESISIDLNQYSVTKGLPALRRALSLKLREKNAIEADPEREILVTCGAAEALFAAVFSLVHDDDEVILFEPAFESYIPNVLMARGKPVILRLEPPGWEIDREALRSAFSDRTRAVIVNTPHNPTGKVFSREELAFIAELCIRHDALAITDEIYEYITYDGVRHISMASLPSMAGRTVTIGGFSKTFSCTGWRLGYCVAPPSVTEAMDKVHTYLTVCAPTPFQHAAVNAFSADTSYFDTLRNFYQKQRGQLCDILQDAGFIVYRPDGSYFMMADFTPFGFSDDREFARMLARDFGVSTVPERAFCHSGGGPGTMVRFCFSRSDETLREAGKRLAALRKLLR